MIEAVPSIKIAQVCLWGNQITGKKMFFYWKSLRVRLVFIYPVVSHQKIETTLNVTDFT